MKKKIYSIDLYETRSLNKKSFGERFSEYKKAFEKLKESLEKDPIENNLVKDAAIHRFELTFELSYRLMRAYLEYKGIMALSPKETFKKSEEMKIISNSDAWIKMMKDRNITSHVYGEEEEAEIYLKIKEVYLEILRKFGETISLIKKEG